MAWICLKKNTAMGENDQRIAYMVEAEHIAMPPDPDYAAAGSIAFTADMTGPGADRDGLIVPESFVEEALFLW